MELDFAIGFLVGANCTYLGKKWEAHSTLEYCINAICTNLKKRKKVATLQLF
jgi:hypothetical protein